MSRIRGAVLIRVGLGAVIGLLAAAPAIAIAGGLNAVVGTAQVNGDVVLANGRGHTRGHILYLFKRDSHGRSSCYGACAHTWKPLLTDDKVFAKKGSGLKQHLFGTVHRSNGKLQVTYNNHPLYLYSQDTQAGVDYGQSCNQFGGHWFMVDKRGNANKLQVGICGTY